MLQRFVYQALLPLRLKRQLICEEVGHKEKLRMYQHSLPQGDQYVGRTVCGLPRHDITFAVLPPRFQSVVNETFVKDAVNSCFPTLPQENYVIGKFLLASLVYHKEFLCDNLPDTHMLFHTQLFSSPDLMSALENLLQNDMFRDDGGMSSTGIPPDIFIATAIDRIPQKVDDLLQQRSVFAGQVTPDFVRDIMAQGYAEIKAMLCQNNIKSEQASEQAEPGPSQRLYHWGGKFHLLPENYEIPKVVCRLIWTHWWLGNPEHQTPPLRSVDSRDISKSQRKRFSDLVYLMKCMKRL